MCYTRVGACCPEDAKRGGLQGLAGVLPAIAPQERDAVEKVIKAENRGRILFISE